MSLDEEEKLQRPSHYIGIGASAGGLEALLEFFGHLDNDTGAAFVVVQHLSPDFKSMMPELLNKSTSMPIYQVIDGIKLEANTIYLMPPRMNMLIAEGCLVLADQMPDGHLHLPIDIFLRALAQDQRHRAIGIVLSGTGSDGTRGIKALKESGGLVIIQEPSSAKFDGMPISAYNTGLADMVLPPKEMGINIVKFINHPFISGATPSLKYSIEDDKENVTLTEIFKLLKKQSSINFAQYKEATVARRIERRLGINQLSSLDAYLELLKKSPKELHIFNKELLIGVTRFFRDTEAFLKVSTEIFPRIIARNNHSDSVRIWVAGCSTGEEAYSMAIILDELLKLKSLDRKIKIFATDVDEDAIAEASTGSYSLDIEQDISEERLNKYFIKKGGHYVVSQHLRQMVIFATHNMIEDPPFSNIDLISCRNVLIYFQHSAQKRVLSSLYFALHRDGYLFLGSSESLGDLKTHFDTFDERSRIFKKISNMRVPIGNLPPTKISQIGKVSGMAAPPVIQAFRSSKAGGRHHLQSVLERMMEAYAPNCIILNEAHDAIHVYGNVSKYTKGITSGRISNNIKDIVNDDLNVAISTALFRCEKSETDVFYKDVALSSETKNKTLIDLSIFYVRDGSQSNAPHHFVVQFLDQKSSTHKKNKENEITYDINEQSQQRIHDLEQELVKKQEHLQVTIEELETTNEELQSTNEELMSANEELQSTNEELQSVNEELYTVNSEYQEKIALLTEANSDLDSVINSADVGIVFLDEQLTIRKFTPSAVKYINLRGADVGRPFYHISHELIYDNLLADITLSNDKGETIEKEIYSQKNHVLLVRLIPYRKNNSVTQTGVLLTITDVSRLRFAESALQRAQEQLRSSLLNRSERLIKRLKDTRDIRILLLDDDAADRKRTKFLLTNVNNRAFNITTCAEIDEAVETATKNPIDLCLVDYKLAGGTAKDFTDRIRNGGLKTPVVVLSGYSDVGMDVEFLNNEVLDFLNKDELSSQLLARSIDYVLERVDMQKALEDFGR